MKKIFFAVMVFIYFIPFFLLAKINVSNFEKIALSFYQAKELYKNGKITEDELENIALAYQKDKNILVKNFVSLSPAQKEEFLSNLYQKKSNLFIYQDFLKDISYSSCSEEIPNWLEWKSKFSKRIKEEKKLKKMLSGALSVSKNGIYRNSGIKVKIEKNDNNGFVCEVFFPSPQLQQISHLQDKFIKINLRGCGKTTTPGRPELPLYRAYLLVPVDSFFKPSWKLTREETIKLDYPVYPYQIPPLDYKNYKFKFMWNKGFYRVDKFFPRKDVKYKFIKIRGKKLLFISLAPVVYNPRKNLLKIRKSIKLNFRFIRKFRKREGLLIEGINDKSENNSQNSSNRGIKVILGNDLLNVSLIDNSENNNQLESLLEEASLESSSSQKGADYLIISPQKFIPNLEKFREWKEEEGYIVKIVSIEEIGKSSQAIKSFIRSEVKKWKPVPSYLLLVGDTQFIPTNENREPIYGDFMGYIPTDYEYSLLDETDPFPDILVGRFPVDNREELKRLIDKTISYEKTPPYRRTNYFKQVLVSAVKEEGRIFHETQIWVANLLEKEGYKPFRIFDWEGGTERKLVSALNKGVILATYRGHGETSGWIKPVFNTDDLPKLKFPYPTVYLATTCQSNKFSQNNPDCFGEQIVKLPTGGAITYLGATMPSYSFYNDELLKGMVEKYQNFKGTIGELMVAGLSRMAQKYGIEDEQVIDQFYFYNILGDPSCVLWPRKPTKPKIKVKLVGKGENEVTIRIDVSFHGAELPTVVVKGEHLFSITKGSSEIDVTGEKEVKVVVTGAGCVPVEKIVKISK